MRSNDSRWMSGWRRMQAFFPRLVAVSGIERVRAGCGALFGILMTGLVTREMLGADANMPMLIAPMGASAVLLFAVPSSPMAQPWPLLTGNLMSAAIGVTCAQWIPDPVWGAAVAMASSISAMFALRCLHPPSGAIALTAVLGGPAIEALGYQFVLMPVAINSVLLLLLALFFNHATGRRPHLLQHAPAAPHHTADAAPGNRLGFSSDDLDAVLKQYNQVLDVSRADLELLLSQAQMQAFRRQVGEITCADIMSRDVVTVEFGTPLEEAWMLLRWHHVKALPVINQARRVIGMVTMTDFIHHASRDQYGSFHDRLRRLVQRSRQSHSEKPEVVGQIMSRRVQTARTDMHIVELVSMLSDKGKHHIPIVDAEGRLSGVLTQSDMVAALYRGHPAETRKSA